MDRNYLSKYCTKNGIPYNNEVVSYDAMGDISEPGGVNTFILENGDHVAERDVITDIEHNAPAGALNEYYQQVNELQQAERWDEITDYYTFLKNRQAAGQ